MTPTPADLMSRMAGDEKHQWAADSTADVLWVLYRDVLRIDPAHPDDPERDRFLLSKGHGPHAYYATLAAAGFFDPSWLDTFGDASSPLGYHPDRNLIPGVEISSGSLGHGLPIAVGVALGLRARNLHTPRVFCLVGDGELDEGSNSEAIAYAGRAGLDRLTVIAVDNGSASHGWPGGIAARFAVEGWVTTTIDGRDHTQIRDALSEPGGPRCVVAEVRAGA